ncbi:MULTISPECIES: hypothetical protein [unclassified Bradyrhizobium]|uniref:hypothetical protein n=1 Tax=unclassified Bradyrhizobium TaxID=2631580 RepID=UPI001FF8158B|nr:MULTISPECIES: hypothetical protein [unclassified Bradyrhizobium]MCK1713967.1 hypothetical protein [Bradyrhizobium sp. 143]MCK1726142.1 hypothetical protein [Bradyrhizobium sp. 142]
MFRRNSGSCNTQDRAEAAFILALSDTFHMLEVALIVALLAALLPNKPDRLDAGGAQ